MRFVKPETCVLTLPNGDQLIVKKRLNRGERADMHMRARTETSIGLVIDRAKLPLATVLAYLIDWSLHNDTVAIRDLSADDRAPILNGLDPDDFNEAYEAILAHEERVQQEIDAAKKTQAGATPSPAISSSPGSCGAVTTTSAP